VLLVSLLSVFSCKETCVGRKTSLIGPRIAFLPYDSRVRGASTAASLLRRVCTVTYVDRQQRHLLAQPLPLDFYSLGSSIH